MKTAIECVNKDSVLEFCEYFQNKHNFDIIQKADATEMRAIGWCLDMMGIMNHERFLSDYATTIARRVYVPFYVGNGTKAQLTRQVITIIHEAQHVIQYDREGFEFMFNYLRSDAARVAYEVDAYRTNFEMGYYFSKKCPSVSSVVNSLKGYSIAYPDIYVAEKMLKSSYAVASKGAIYSGVSKDAIKWWNTKRKG